MNSIYKRNLSNNISFKSTLILIEELINNRINSNFRKISISGSSSGKFKLCFTLFNETGYSMRFLELDSFRLFNNKGTIGEEIVYIERFIESLRKGLLFNVI